MVSIGHGEREVPQHKMQTEIVLTQKLIVAASGADPGGLDDAEDGTAFLGQNVGPNGPPGVPIGGGYLFVDNGGNLKYKGPSGTVTQLAVP